MPITNSGGVTSPITITLNCNTVSDAGDAIPFADTLGVPVCVAKNMSNVDSSGRPRTVNVRSVFGSVNASEPAATARSPALILALPANISSGVGVMVFLVGSARGTATKNAVPARSNAAKSLNVVVPF